MKKEVAHVISSATQNAFHTPAAPAILLNIKAAGIIITTYLINDITNDGTPFPRPSSAPDATTDTVETTNPALIILSASPPLAMVTG